MIALLTVLLAQAATANQPLEISCSGGGNAAKMAMGSAWSYNSFLGVSRTTVTGVRSEGYGDTVELRFFTGDDRARLPRSLLPPAHGGNDGWFRLTNVRSDGRFIDAVARVNFLNAPKIHIDRQTGEISISAGQMGSYFGTCQRVDASAPVKF